VILTVCVNSIAHLMKRFRATHPQRPIDIMMAVFNLAAQSITADKIGGDHKSDEIQDRHYYKQVKGEFKSFLPSRLRLFVGIMDRHFRIAGARCFVTLDLLSISARSGALSVMATSLLRRSGK